MDRRHFVKTSILGALANPIHAMSKTNSIQRKNRKKVSGMRVVTQEETVTHKVI